ncbi:P-loop containing nucleoside triphosphate hydrolase protein [Fomitiporia mediterranea MF3/22]|uniref:P-loop containing nucleoside triphosphate hydrolase protein n=1 Tax=Fomitiporia mediterranea (strain MF3/22) TaxID=694068 RepID=UPI0004408568|nr:P-loop containing nucleoside triphosphate hydrolase protein [Fomitiporia mediterranea MF3/22]EJD06049.1 P-loop containing nucleoside triphosphate hydrolase protein [Fomitiporia mediterranea MF3/22]
MGKRRTSGVESDEDDAEFVTSSKRARVEDDDDDHVREEESDEQKAFEARYGELVRASIEAKQHYQGRIADCGIIQSLEMQQFMCHPRLSFTFGPQINFIIGHNGSGKSAVLSALTIALGGKAITTGRGSGLKSFIQEGKTWSEVTITLKNEGEDAYRPDVYGKSITIIRNFTKAGSTGYKIKSRDGKTVSTKREELAKICDHMNIQVDNPMNVLTQDSARQFLSTSHPTDKYEFFLKATQLKQLSEEYESCLENIGKTYKILEAKKEVLPELKATAIEAQNRYKGAQLALQTRGRVTELKQEQAWAFVQDKEEEMKAKIDEVARRSRKLPKLKDKVDATKKLHDEHSEKIADLETEIKDLGDINHLNLQQAEIKGKLKANKTKLREYQASEKEMSIELKTAKNTIEDLQERIATETRKLQEDKKAEQEERQRKLEAAKKAVSEHEARRNEINDHLRQFEEDMGPLKTKVADTETTLQNSKATMESCSRRLNELNRQAVDSVSVYGNNLQQILERISTMTWHGKKPVGPLGLYVSLRERQWTDIIRATLGSYMTSFAVTDARDRVQLRKLLVDSKNGHMQVFVASDDLFEYESGEPPRDKVTILRVLEVTGEYVKRILINNSRIERTFLAPTRVEAERLAEEANGGTAISADFYRVTAYPEGGSYSQPIQELRNEDPRMRKLIFDCRHWKEKGRQADEAYQQANTEMQKYRQELDELNRQRAIRSVPKGIENRLFKLKQDLRTLQNEHNDDIPVNISSLEEAMKEAEETKENIVNQFKDLVTAKGEVDNEQKQLLTELKKITAQVDEFESKRSDLEVRLVDASGKRSRAQAEMRTCEEKLRVEQRAIAELELAAKNLQLEFENWTRHAEEFCDGKRVENPRKSTEVERELKSVQAALKQQEKENGATLEELEEALQEAKQKYQNTEQDLKNLSKLNRALKESIVRRLQRWHDFRRHIALRTKLQFQHHLAMRAYFGKVLFDHDKQKLELKVQTDDQAATQGLNKDPKSLSGGEKSFATICLLLALWEAIGCPIRCLDEFDVFMDAVNRRISMKMMIDTANASDSKQYILITPQDMSTVAFGPTVRVHRMGDPERGQTTL